jgi:hypothetical protein
MNVVARQALGKAAMPPYARGSLAIFGRLMADTDYPYTEHAKFSERRTA